MKKRILLSSLFILLSLCSQAQDPEFTQFNNNPLYTNPATAGSADCDRRTFVNYRNQWSNLPGPLITTTLSGDFGVEKLHGSVGLNVLRDVSGSGLLTTTSIGAIYSFAAELSDDLKLHIGLEPQFMQRTVDFTRIRYADQIQANRGFVLPAQEPLVNEPVNIFNLNTGVFLKGENYHAGVAVHNVLEPVQSFYGDTKSTLPRRFTVHGGYRVNFSSNDEHYIEPIALFMVQNQFTQLNGTLQYRFGSVISGVGWRQTFGEFNNADALLLVLGAQMKRFKAVYSYDRTVSDARTAAPSSHEVSLMVNLCKP